MTEPATAPGPSLRERLGWRAERRPEPGFAHTLGAGAAAFVVFALFALCIAIDENDLRVQGIILFLALAAVAFVVGARNPGPIRTAAVTAIVFAVPIFWFFVFAGDGGGGEGAVRGIYLLSIVSYAVLYGLTWTSGRAILLGLALILAAAWITAEVQGLDRGGIPFGGSVERQSDFQIDSGSSGSDFGNDSVFAEEPDDNATATSIVAMVIGLGYLFAAWRVDKKGLAGAATPFIVAGAISTIGGAVGLGVSEETLIGSGILATAAGAAVGFVGGQGLHRRASTWIGVITAVIGLIVVVVGIVTGEDGDGGSAWGYAGAFAIVAALLGAVAWYAAPRLSEYVDGDIEAPRTGESGAAATPSTT